MSERLKDILSDEIKLTAFKKILLQYPGTTEDMLEKLIAAYESRVGKKEEFIEMGYSNALAEKSLDHLKYPRPPGWHSVFFYPESNRLRTLYIFLIFLLCGIPFLKSDQLVIEHGDTMHIAAILIGLILTIFWGTALKIGLSILVNMRRNRQSLGIQNTLPKNPIPIAILCGHAIGVIVGLLMIFWGWQE